MIDKNKVYKTRDGREVRIYAVDGDGSGTIHGAIRTEAGWRIAVWTASGSYNGNNLTHDKDLIEVKPRIKREVWVNVYPDGFSDAVEVRAYYAKQYADQHALENRIACVKLTIDVEEGEGL